MPQHKKSGTVPKTSSCRGQHAVPRGYYMIPAKEIRWLISKQRGTSAQRLLERHCHSDSQAPLRQMESIWRVRQEHSRHRPQTPSTWRMITGNNQRAAGGRFLPPPLKPAEKPMDAEALIGIGFGFVADATKGVLAKTLVEKATAKQFCSKDITKNLENGSLMRRR